MDDIVNDTISRQAALDIYDDYNVAVENGELEAYGKHRERLLELPPAESELEKKIRAIGYTGKEGRIYIGGRLFAVRELPQ